MSVNQELLAMGREAEDVAFEYFKSFGLDVKHNEVDPDDKLSIYDNLKWGDIAVSHNEMTFLFDVKRGHFISDTSIKGFKGQFFILVPNGDISDPRKFKVVKSSTISRYYQNVTSSKVHFGPSGDYGYRFTKLKNFVLLEEFIPEFIKRIIIMNNEIDEKNSVYPHLRPWSEFLARNFTKVLPQNVKVSIFDRGNF